MLVSVFRAATGRSTRVIGPQVSDVQMNELIIDYTTVRPLSYVVHRGISTCKASRHLRCMSQEKDE